LIIKQTDFLLDSDDSDEDVFGPDPLYSLIPKMKTHVEKCLGLGFGQNSGYEKLESIMIDMAIPTNYVDPFEDNMKPVAGVEFYFGMRDGKKRFLIRWSLEEMGVVIPVKRGI
jgi:hypothetical protein